MRWGRISQTAAVCFTFFCKFLFFINQVELNLLYICVFLLFHSLPKNIAFNSFLFTFPIVFLGNSSTTRRTVGIWYGTIRPLAHCFKSTRLISCVQKVNKAGLNGCGHNVTWIKLINTTKTYSYLAGRQSDNCRHSLPPLGIRFAHHCAVCDVIMWQKVSLNFQSTMGKFSTTTFNDQFLV